MMVRQNAAARRCEIWIGCRERDTYAGNEEYRETVRRYRAMGWRVCVFLEGREPRLQGAAVMLNHRWLGSF
ncbi:MAG: hypothetical protein KH050_10265 [Clostridiaceae bacterium]|nr:hypothetical protein [Clostridiaceae bacterium]